MTLCEICEENQSKYKCPKCRLPFCSLLCSKKHKETPCESADRMNEAPDIGAALLKKIELLEEKFREDNVAPIPTAKLGELGCNAGITKPLEDVRLQQLIVDILTSEDPDKMLQDQMTTNVSFYQYTERILEFLELGSE